ncbi:MAG: tetratricopeptide repeat protein [Gemmatimonadaceae bacterium]
MTTPNAQAKARRGTDEDSIIEWLTVHKREVTWGIVVLAVIVFGVWYYKRSQSLRAQRAETQYYQARQSAAAGNIPGAISDLQKVAARYEGTQAGTEAALTLAQTFYEQKKFKDGIAALKKVEDKAPDDFKASVHVLAAAGYEELSDFAGAAAEYEAAARTTRFPADKSQYQANAARDYMTAGKKDQAKAIWTELAKPDTGAIASEAKVRLGEVTAKPMTT